MGRNGIEKDIPAHLHCKYIKNAFAAVAGCEGPLQAGEKRGEEKEGREKESKKRDGKDTSRNKLLVTVL